MVRPEVGDKKAHTQSGSTGGSMDMTRHDILRPTHQGEVLDQGQSLMSAIALFLVLLCTVYRTSRNVLTDAV